MKKGAGELNGFLDKGSTFRGDLEFEDTMRVDGKFFGKIISKNELIVGESAQVEGEISVGNVAISGEVKGKITATGRIEIHRGGRVFCDIETAALIIEEGAVFEGNCGMKKDKSPSSSGSIAPKPLSVRTGS